jgi:hypothetical protein
MSKDARHQGVLRLLQEPIREREFAGWPMGFHDLRSPGLAEFPGFSDFLKVSLTPKEFSMEPGRAKSCC